MPRTFPASKSAPSKSPWSGGPVACRACRLPAKDDHQTRRRPSAEARCREPADRGLENERRRLAKDCGRPAGCAEENARGSEEENRRTANQGQCTAGGEGCREVRLCFLNPPSWGRDERSSLLGGRPKAGRGGGCFRNDFSNA